MSNGFCGNCGAKVERGLSAPDGGESLAAPVHLPQHLARRILDSRGLLEGERKQITVLFADIKGSTTLIEDLDPEDADLRLRPALDAMINAVHRYEGTINRVQGDGIMALFGAPLAHEDNAVRAAYAALDMQKGVRAACDDDIAIRVGLHAGEVFVRAIHNDLSVDYDAIGPTVHLAARMEQMASPGAIYCTANVMRMAKGFVEARPLGEHSVKGVRHPIEFFQIVGHTSARTRWEVTAAEDWHPSSGERASPPDCSAHWNWPAMARARLLPLKARREQENRGCSTNFSGRLNCPTGRCSRPPPPLTCVARLIWPSPTCCVPGARFPKRLLPPKRPAACMRVLPRYRQARRPMFRHCNRCSSLLSTMPIGRRWSRQFGGSE